MVVARLSHEQILSQAHVAANHVFALPKNRADSLPDTMRCIIADENESIGVPSGQSFESLLSGRPRW